MRKPILFLSLIAIFAGAFAIYWGSVIAPRHIAKIIEDTEKSLFSAAPVVEVGSSRETPPYKGQALEFLGDPGLVASYPKEFVDLQKNRLRKFIEAIKGDVGSVDDWLAIGFVKKQFDNFSGVRDVWEYAKILNPANPVSHYNLATLYSAYFNDFELAEKYYLEAVRLDPNSVYTHIGLAEFYRDFYTEKFSEIESVLLNGLQYLPNDLNLMINLGFYYKEVGDNGKAIWYLEKVTDSSDINDEQRAILEKEVSQLR